MRRRFGHITPRYLVDRAVAWAYELTNPDAPWLTSGSIATLASALRASDRGLEWGSGRSTLWLARRTDHLVSVEHSPEWHARIHLQLEKALVTNVDYRLVRALEDEDGWATHYVEAGAGDCELASLDYVLVDGVFRAECALRAVDLLRPGGVLVLDNANRYLAHPSRSPDSLKTAPEPKWAEFNARVAEWRRMWTSNGVTDTALWVKAA